MTDSELDSLGTSLLAQDSQARRGQRVITWQDSAGDTIDITPAQQERLEKAGKWPRSKYSEYCKVSHGLHFGAPTFTDEQLAKEWLS